MVRTWGPHEHTYPLSGSTAYRAPAQAMAWGLTPEEALFRIAREFSNKISDLAHDEGGIHALDS